MILSKKRKTKALISLRGCAGWSAPLLFANRDDMVSRVNLPENKLLKANRRAKDERVAMYIIPHHQKNQFIVHGVQCPIIKNQQLR